MKKGLAQLASGALIAFGAFGVIAILLSRLEPALLELKPKPTPEPLPPMPPLPPAAQVPTQITDDPIPLAPTKRYLATIAVTWPLSALASPAAVKAQAEGMGFKDIIVSTGAPIGWPPPARSVKGDYYVEGTYVAGPMAVAKSQAGGQVRVVNAWQV